ncbi:MAG TPA: GMP synthase (glutamine-hydrolyzing), partial [Clostridia bacterium]|nr:GMP synthase (glutamine-hydrolyzing) [Clostridia bacterium]
IAPLGDLFKDEIRRIGEALGMPHEMTNMQSFPWSGLALRIMGECTVDKINLLRWADCQFCNDIKEAGLSRRLWKYFAMLYEIPYQEEQPALAIALRALSISHTGSDLRALPARLPYDLLERYTQRAQAYDKRIHKIIYDLTPSVSLQESEWR